MKNINIKLLCIILILLPIKSNMCGINLTSNFLRFETPNEASFNKFIDNPVGLYNGNPDVTIPIYTLKDGMIELPITLRYNTSGIKVAEESSWVGLGWNLNVGGVITQTIVGLTDKFMDGIDENLRDQINQLEPGEFNKYKVMSEETDNSHNNNMSRTLFGAIHDQTDRYGKDFRVSPDVFYMTIPGFSGRFILDNNTAYFLKKERDIKIENSEFMIRDISGTYIKISFKVTTDQGIIHYFEAGKPSSVGYERDKIVSQHYMLRQTEYPNGQKVYYEYAEKKYEDDMFSESFSVDYAFVLGHVKSNPGNYTYFKAGKPVYYYSTKFGSAPKMTRYEYFLTKITTSNYVITFTNTKYTLQNIQIVPRVITPESLRKTFKFHISYFDLDIKPGYENNYWTNTFIDSQRARLDAISEISANKEINKYQFHYNSTNLPRRNSYAIDYWGHYNGKQENTTLLPNLKYMVGPKFKDLSEYTARKALDGGSFAVDFACRAYDFNYAKACILEKITYPTGGAMVIKYEPNKFNGPFLPNVSQLGEMDNYMNTGSLPEKENTGCGVRVKSINQIEHENDTDTIKTNYKYLGGILHDEVAFYDKNLWIRGLQRFEIEKQSPPDPFDEAKGRVVGRCEYLHPYTECVEISSSNCINNPYSFSSGVGYTFVEESKQININESINTLYTFYNESNINNRLGMYSHDVWYNVASNANYTISNPLNGMLQSKASEALHEYFEYKKPIKNKFIWGARIVDNANRFANLYYYNNLQIPNIYMIGASSDWASVMSSMITGAVIPTPCFDFSQYNTFLGRPFKGSYGEARFTITLSEVPVYTVLLDKKYTTQDDILSTEKYEYNENTLQVKTILVNSDEHEYDNRNAQKITFKYPNDYDCEPYGTMTSKNQIGGVVEKTTYKKNYLTNSTYTKYLYFQGNNYLPGAIYNSRIKDPLHGISEASSCGGLNSSVYAGTPDVVFERYDEYGNPLSIIENDAVKVVYLWGYNSQYPIAEIKNADYLQVEEILTEATISGLANNPAPTHEGIMSLGSFLRDALSASLVTIYTYKPLAGITSKTDPRGITTYYEYDEFGRLICTKDRSGKIIQNFSYHLKP